MPLALAALATGCSIPRQIRLAPESAGSCRTLPADRAGSPSVRWTGPFDVRNKTRLDSWCAGVGPVLFANASVAGPDRAEPALDAITFVSWNVHVGAADIDAFVRDLRSGRIAGEGRSGPIVLMLQEAVRTEGVPGTVPAGASVAGWIGSSAADVRRNDIGQVARRLGASVLYVPSMRNGPGSPTRAPSDRGNAILSTLALSEPIAIELPGARQRRVAVVSSVIVRAGNTRIRLSIGAVHLDTFGGPRSLWVFGGPAIRAAQSRTLLEALPDGPLVLGADLNSWLGPGETAARDLFEFLPQTPPVAAREATSRFRLMLDYLFFRLPSGRRAHLTRMPSRYGSDHVPLVGWIE